MGRRLTVVMYHYVREPEDSGFPRLNALSVREFGEQLHYLSRHYHILSGDDLLEILATGDELPPRAALLTFDDGYKDHFTEVLPRLVDRGLSGCFFPCAMSALESRVLLVNKIHFVLAAVPEASMLVEFVFDAVERNRVEFGLQEAQDYWKRLAVASRFDPSEIVFIKRMLQRELPFRMRTAIANELFARHVTSDEEGFSEELYMSVADLTEMRSCGMLIGNHGYNHHWMDSLSAADQEREVDLSLRFLDRVGQSLERWMIAYPYGAWNDSLLAILERRNCALGLSTRVAVADLDGDDLLTLPRMDTNDFPKAASTGSTNRVS